jgi:lipopolysaccharide transport system ATP-binding protein
MSDITLRAEGIYKRFRKGEVFDSLRDLVPVFTGKLFTRDGVRLTDEREFWALQDVSFAVRRGEAFGIIGHNGAGKSTILKILSRIMKPTSGNLFVDGRLSALIEVSAGFHPDLTGRENVYLNGTILGMKRAEIDSKLDAIVDFSGLEEFIDTPVKRYSSGMFARLGFSVAAHVEPEILIVDEVLSVGDFMFQQKCIARMNEVIRSGTSVLFVSHNLRAVTELCGRGLLLEHGKVAMTGDMRQVVATYLNNVQRKLAEAGGKALEFTAVKLRSEHEEVVRLESGSTVYLDIEAIARRQCKKVAVAVSLLDENAYLVFNTSTERLGYPVYDMEAGDKLKCTFQMDMNMLSGTFAVCVSLFQYHTGTAFDRWAPAATFFVSPSSIGSTGLVDCNPRLIEQRIEVAEGGVRSPPGSASVDVVTDS